MKQQKRSSFDTLEARRLLATLTVTSNADTNAAGTLRWAITQANLTAGTADLIHFNLPSDALVISVTSQLPSISGPLTIDATTQAGFSGSPKVMIRGNAVASTNGLVVTGDNVTLRALSIGNFIAAGGAGGVGVLVSAGASGARIEQCYVGLNPDGTTASANFRGVLSADGNTQVLDSVISGNNADAVTLGGSFAKVDGCIVGLRPDGITAMSNGGVGVTINAGSLGLVTDSVIAANNGGVLVTGAATLTTITGSIINMSADRLLRRSTGGHSVHYLGTTGSVTNSFVAGGSFGNSAIRIENTSGVTVQGNDVGIGANPNLGFGSAVGIELLNTDDSTVRTNRVGDSSIGIKIKDGDGNVVRNNGVGRQIDIVNPFFASNAVGVVVENGNENAIGGADNGQRNYIGNSGGQGVWIKSGVSNPVLRNAFNNNNGLDIDLGNAGLDPIDAAGPTYDADTGANTLLNTGVPSDTFFPNDGFSSGDSFARYGLTIPDASETFRVDFYEALPNKASAVRWLGSTTGTYGGPTLLGVDFSFPSQPDGTYLSLTVTRVVAGVATDTSELSFPVRIVGSPFIRSNAFNFEAGHSVSYTFSRDVAASLNADDLSVKDLANNLTYTPSFFLYNGPTNTVTFRFNTPLPDGNYRATLDRDGVTSPVQLIAGNQPVNLTAEGDDTVDFHVLAGDANRDRTVNFSDLLVIAANYGQSGRTFSQGNFDYSADGLVGFTDLLLIAGRYGRSLLSDASPPPGGAKGRRDRAIDGLV